jgi:Uma2 family endonuclease
MTVTLEKPQQHQYTPEEYLALEETAEFKNEYRDGKIIPMTGGTTHHNRIALNLSLALCLGLKGQAYDVFMESVRLWIPEASVYTYPDIMVISGQPEYHNHRKDTIVNPQVIIEVLSRSTRNYDRGDKFDFYKTIPTFKEYILVEQSQAKIAQFVKTDAKRWLYREYDAEDTALSFGMFQLEVSIADIYEKAEFIASEGSTSVDDRKADDGEDFNE